MSPSEFPLCIFVHGPIVFAQVNSRLILGEQVAKDNHSFLPLVVAMLVTTINFQNTAIKLSEPS